MMQPLAAASGAQRLNSSGIGKLVFLLSLAIVSGSRNGNIERQNYEQFMSKKKNARENSCENYEQPSSWKNLPKDPPGTSWEDLSKNATGWEDLSKNAFFENGLKTYIVRRNSSRDSIWYRFHRKWSIL